MGVGERVHTRHRRSGATVVLLWNRVGGSAEWNGPGGGPGLSILPCPDGWPLRSLKSSSPAFNSRWRAKQNQGGSLNKSRTFCGHLYGGVSLITSFNRFFFLVTGASLLTVIGCGSAVRTDSVTKFREGVAQTQKEAQVAFHDANALAREESIQYVLASTRPGITEKDFTPALSPDATAAWDSAFAALQSYASSLERLLSPDQANQFGNAAVSLGSELKTGSVGAQINPGVATAFTEFGQILITLKAETDAQAAMRKANPGVQSVLNSMADALGGNDRTGVRGTVWANWEAKLAEQPIRAYADAVKNGNNMQQKRAAVDSFLAMLDERDAQLASLASLRQSILLLGAAHASAATGSTADVAEIIATISQQLDETKSLVQQFSGKAAQTAKPKTSPAAEITNG